MAAICLAYLSVRVAYCVFAAFTSGFSSFEAVATGSRLGASMRTGCRPVGVSASAMKCAVDGGAIMVGRHSASTW